MVGKKGFKRNGAPGLSASDFTNHPEIVACLRDLNASFPRDKNPLIVSDVIDDAGHQYVNLVQKGGGVLGVALVGYTYILEQMGIRFLRLAGTSAGAINTALITVTGKKEDEKSESILETISNLNFFDIVDGHPAIRWLIKKFITHQDFPTQIRRWFSRILIFLLILFGGDICFLGLEKKFTLVSDVTKAFFVMTGFYLLLIGLIIFYIFRLLRRVKNSGFGVNPGNYFYDWIKQQLLENGVATVSDLEKKAATIPHLHLRVPHSKGAESLKGDVTFITSELVTENEIQFPAMCYLFREKNNVDSLQPAGFVRALMSIPIFFESYMISDIPTSSEEIKNAWLEKMDEPSPPDMARFIDGGLLSNFPISIFYDPDEDIPMLPVFGIDLDDSNPANSDRSATNWSLTGYFGRIFNTIRNFYDKDFLLKNKIFEKGIGKIELSDFNWLNFFLTDEDKINMFIRGARAATTFLKEFNWENYKENSSNLQQLLNKKKN
jgi:NTE family protein